MRRPSLLANHCEDHLLMEYLIARGIFEFNVAAQVSTSDWREPFWELPPSQSLPQRNWASLSFTLHARSAQVLGLCGVLVSTKPWFFPALI